LAAGVVATTISGYWVQVVEGGVMAAVVVLNAATGKGDFASLFGRFRGSVGRGSRSPLGEK
jgi:hypothetical protein